MRASIPAKQDVVIVSGRVTNVQFPTTVAGFGNFAFYNNHNASGFLPSVSSLANNGGTKYWQVDANGIAAQGRVLSETMGNSTNSKRPYNPITDLLNDIDTTGPAGTENGVRTVGWDEAKPNPS